VTIADSEILLLDTSIVVDVARNNRSGRAIIDNYALRTRIDRPLISVITAGEMYGIAKSKPWTEDQTKQLEQLLAVIGRFKTGHLWALFTGRVVAC
jgi:predicted nucleic acid-binding protein